MSDLVKKLLEITEKQSKMLDKIAQQLEVISPSEDQVIGPYFAQLKDIAKQALLDAQISGKYDVLVSHSSGSNDRDIQLVWTFDHMVAASFQSVLKKSTDSAIAKATALLQSLSKQGKIGKFKVSKSIKMPS